MGVEYYIYDTLNKTFYDLGKGAWYQLDMHLISDKELLKEWLTDVWVKEGYVEPDRIGYMETVAVELHDSFGSTPPRFLGIVNDCGDDLCEMRSLGYQCVGTRYHEKGSDSYKEELAYLNRHLFDYEYALLFTDFIPNARTRY